MTEAPLQAGHDPGGRVRLKLRDPTTRSRALFSDDMRYRHLLERRWDEAPFGTPGACLFVMMNPSTADEMVDDPTVRRCMDFARLWGFSAAVVCNMFTFRATYPKMLIEVSDPIGPEGNAVLIEQAALAGRIICAFGRPPPALSWRCAEVAALLAGRPLEALACTKDGWPGHPLYLAKTTVPKPWSPPQI